MTEESLDVKLYDKLIGTLTPTRNGARFQFAKEIVDQKLGSPLLSTSLLVQEQAFDVAATGNWFSGLLPEDTRLEEVRRFYGIGDTNYSSVLEQVGWECAGAVAVMPKDSKMPLHHKPDALLLSPEELAARLTALPSHPYDSMDTMRISLGGFQEKLCVTANQISVPTTARVDLGEIKIPLGGALSTHILKPQPARFPGMIAGEAWAMAVASQVTKTAVTALLATELAPETLIVERFDRTRLSGELQRIHQEDCAQAMGLSSTQKYAASGSPKKSDPSFIKIAALLNQFSYNPFSELIRLLEQMIVNVILGNTDAHAKNYALLHPDESTISLSPMYDVVPALEITPKVLFMGMRIDGRIRIDRIEREQLENEAQTWGLPASIIRSTVNETAERLRAGITYADDLYQQAGSTHSAAALKRLSLICANP